MASTAPKFIEISDLQNELWANTQKPRNFAVHAKRRIGVDITAKRDWMVPSEDYTDKVMKTFPKLPDGYKYTQLYVSKGKHCKGNSFTGHKIGILIGNRGATLVSREPKHMITHIKNAMAFEGFKVSKAEIKKIKMTAMEELSVRKEVAELLNLEVEDIYKANRVYNDSDKSNWRNTNKSGFTEKLEDFITKAYPTYKVNLHNVVNYGHKFTYQDVETDIRVGEYHKNKNKSVSHQTPVVKPTPKVEEKTKQGEDLDDIIFTSISRVITSELKDLNGLMKHNWTRTKIEGKESVKIDISYQGSSTPLVSLYWNTKESLEFVAIALKRLKFLKPSNA